jgi:hypothetical protein
VVIVDADALPASERHNPAAPSAVREAALVLHFCFAARLCLAVPSLFAQIVIGPRMQIIDQLELLLPGLNHADASSRA